MAQYKPLQVERGRERGREGEREEEVYCRLTLRLLVSTCCCRFCCNLSCASGCGLSLSLGSFCSPPQDALVSGDGDYDTAKLIWNRSASAEPAVIVRCTGAADVIKVL